MTYRYLSELAAAWAGAAAAFGGPAASDPGARDPASIIYALYGHYRSGGGGMAAPEVAALLTPATRALFMRALASDDDANELDSDPFCDCQDWADIEVQNVVLKMQRTGRAVATATISDSVDGRQPRAITFRLQRLAGRWRIEDVGPKGGWSLRSMGDDGRTEARNGR